VIRFEGDQKMTANEFSKMFIMASVEKIIASMDEVFASNPAWYSSFTEKEKADIKEQLVKRAGGMKNYYGIDKLAGKETT
jgi:hypothetical protein